MAWESSDVVRFDLGSPHSRSNDGSLSLMSCRFGGHNLHWFSDALGLV